MQVKTEKGRLESINYEGITWVDIENPTQNEIDVLSRNYRFHPLTLADCLSKRQLTKVEEYEEYLFILLHFPNCNNKDRSIVSNQLSIFLGKDYLVTMHPSDFKPVKELFHASKIDELHGELKGSAGHLLYAIIDRSVNELFPILDNIMSDLDEMEDRVFDAKVSAAGEISRLRREIADLRRIVSPLRRLIVELGTKTQKFGVRGLSLYLSDVKDHIEKAWDVLEEAKETVEIYMDTDYVLSTETTNKVLAVLTIAFTITIPFTTIGTIYGMNIPLPGGISKPLSFLGPYTSFLILLLTMAVPAVLMTWYFRRLGWV